MINVFLGVQINALGFLLNGHDGQSHINAAVELAFLDLHKAQTEGLTYKYHPYLVYQYNRCYFVAMYSNYY